MALRKGKLIKSKGSYYWLADDLGMAYNLQMVHLQDFAGDVQKMNERIDIIGGQLNEIPNHAAGWKPTIGIHLTTWNALPEQWKVIFQAKTHIMLYDSTADLKADDPVDSFPSIPTYRQVDLVWVSDNEVWTKYDQNAFAYHYQNVKPVPVADSATPPVVPPVTPPVSTVTSEAEIRLACLDIAFDIAVHNAPDELLLQVDALTQLADKLVAWVLK